MFMLELETRNYSFQCFAATEKECYEHLWKAWKKHCVQCRLPLGDSFFPTEESLASGDLNLTRLDSLPVCLRDGEPIL